MKDKDITSLKGIGEKRAEIFRKKGINTVHDLLCFFPRTYEDRSKTKKISECEDGESVCIRARVKAFVKTYRPRRNMTISSMPVTDDTRVLNIVWYNNRFVEGQYKPGDEYVFYGRVSRDKYGKWQMANPVAEKPDAEGHYTGKIVPIYPLSGNLTQKLMQTAIESALNEAGRLDEYLPEDIREKYKIAEINFAMHNIHFPKSEEDYLIARRRFVFEELLFLQLALVMHKGMNKKGAGIVFEDTDCIGDFVHLLPFSLTGAQERTIKDIASDLKSGRIMSRLVQGDVGSGKTAVAAAAMYAAVKNGHQAAIMAPTEILAKQHKETLDAFFEGTGIRTVLLTGSMKAAEKRRAYESVSMGVADVVIGTHALIQDDLFFSDLALVVADEQHRFGVEQRARLMAKGHDPHLLVMSATPIPRTLALILYGDLDISVIDELPPGRKPVKTYAVGENMRKRVYAFVEKNIRAGSQAYIVCPLVEETETSDLKNAESLCRTLSEIFPDIKMGIVHGRMKPKLKDEVMNEFIRGDIQALVSTTVIEVGVNVPNASVMVIENAERFGLSQLHQLRGRVGRGQDQAFCIMFSHGKNEITQKRMETMCKSNDGFYISEQDLKLRGPGDFFGTRQHGLPEMRIANLFEDADILSEAQAAAKAILTEDAELKSEKYKALRERSEKMIPKDTVLN